MKKQSNLNPYAAAYVPVAIRESRSPTSVTERGSRNYNGNIWPQTPQQTINNQQLCYADALRRSPVKKQSASSSHISPSQSSTLVTEQQLMDALRLSPAKNQPASSRISPSQSATQFTEEQVLTDEEVDMEYLRMLFHSVDDESLLDVYRLNHGDLEDAIDMLEQLEIDEVDLSGSLPDELDFSDVSHFVVPYNDSDSAEQRNVAAETSAPSGHLPSSKFL